MTNFDRSASRAQSASFKWQITNQPEHYDVTAMTVADMDFETPSFIFDHLIPRSHVLGYDAVDDAYFNSIINWQQRHQQIALQKDEIIPLTGVLPGLSYAIRALSQPEESVLVFTPVYNPFFAAIKGAHRNLLAFDLSLQEDGQYHIDFEALEKVFHSQPIPLMVICNPQNPSGHVWSKEDLNHLIELAKHYNSRIIADEIHQDLVYNPREFTSFLTLPEADQYGLVLTAATKTFNMPGIKNAYMLIKDATMRDQIQAIISGEFGDDTISTFGYRATTAALTYGEQWHDDLMTYLDHNRHVAFDLFKQSKITAMWPQATYLMWLDFSATGLDDATIADKLVNEAKVELNDGARYGEAGAHWFRLNFATQTAQMTAAIERIIHVFG